MLSDLQIIEGCSAHKRKSQQMLYDKYSPLLLGICLRYAGSRDEAEDILQDSFLRIFNNIEEFSGKGSFTGWLRKIVVNTAITNYHATLKFRHNVDIDEFVTDEALVSSFEESLYSSEELYLVLNELPTGYRMVFNLYAVEGYKHKEISEMLNIDINTSKSQYSRAKDSIRTKLGALRKLKDSYSADGS
jgi:RNA polymerase sigma factor (sigma-70 family)